MLYGIAQPGIGVILVSWMSLDFVEIVFPLASLHHTKGTKSPICRDASPVIKGSISADLRFRKGNIYVSVGNAVFPYPQVSQDRWRVCKDASRSSQNRH